MRLYLILLIVAFTQISLGQNIQGKITYRATANLEDYLKSVTKSTKFNENQKKARIKNIKNSIPVNFVLLFKGEEAIYGSENDMHTMRKLGLLMNPTAFLGRYQYTYYQNLKTKEKFRQYFFTKEVLVDLEDITWKLTKETKKIGKYICYKAVADVRGMKSEGMIHLSPVIAWYTTEIPVAFGIQNFSGLPGLILQLNAKYDKGTILFNAEKIELNSKENIKIKRPKGKKVSEEKYNELRNKMIKLREHSRR